MFPPFQDLLLPLLRLAAESKEPIAILAVADFLASHLTLTEEDREELLLSGRQSRFTNRVNWAASHLRTANLTLSVRTIEPDISKEYADISHCAHHTDLLAEWRVPNSIVKLICGNRVMEADKQFPVLIGFHQNGSLF